MANIDFKTINEALTQPISKNFWMSYKDGNYTAGNEVSFFSKNIQPSEHLTYDISNNKVLVHVDYKGALKDVTIFRGDYFCDTGHYWPGVWVHKDFTKYGPYSFSIKMDNNIIDFANCDWPYKTSLLGNIFPITQYSGQKVKATILTYAPVSTCGDIRPRGVIYGIQIINISDERLIGSVVVPKAFAANNITGSCLEADLVCYRDLNINLLDFKDKKLEIAFDLAPNQSIWVPVLLSSFGDPVLEEVDNKGSLFWLNSTWSYFKGMTGTLSMPDDDFTAEFFERSIHQCFECIGMDGNGKINGSNWGSYPTTLQIWMKDLYYSYLPFYMFEPDFFKKGILWFAEHNLRPKGVEFEGGVNHSVSNSLTPVIMSGMYYSSCGDKDFFIQNPNVKEKIIYVLEELLSTRKDKSVWLFTSKFISDGLSASDYHTGTNLCAWFSFKTFARILKDVYGEIQLAEDYNQIANRIRDAIETNNVIDGPFGKQYIEGINADGSIPWMGHEGEESDTTLMPLYGYVDYDNSAYKNYTRFAMTEHNAAYSSSTRGIMWGETLDPLPVKATFPGYITGFANSVDSESMVGEKGYLTEIRKLTDVDGSVWWWPYDTETPEYGKPARRYVCGKCGWASGLFVGLFTNQILGLKYDAPAKTLSFRPFSPSSDFVWDDFKLGNGKFSVSYSKCIDGVEVTISNKNFYSISLELELIMKKDGRTKMVYENGLEYKIDLKQGQFLNKKTIKYSDTLQMYETKKIKVIE